MLQSVTISFLPLESTVWCSFIDSLLVKQGVVKYINISTTNNNNNVLFTKSYIVLFSDGMINILNEKYVFDNEQDAINALPVATPNVSQTSTPTVTPTLSVSASSGVPLTPTPTATATKSVTPTVSKSVTPTVTKSFTPTVTKSVTPTVSKSVTPTVTTSVTKTPSVPTTPTTGLSVKVNGNKLVDGSGNTLQLRGVNCSGLEFVSIQGWSPTDPWGGGKPNISAIKSWGVNVIRVPLNEASWLGLTTYDYDGTKRLADPSGNYKATVHDIVNQANAAGMYVILDLHISSPDAPITGQVGKVATSPGHQNEMADLDHSIDFWTSIANEFKTNPSIIFDLFNEPHIDNFTINTAGLSNEQIQAAVWKILRDGGTCNVILVQEGTIQVPYQTAGMQQMVNAVRATGSTNVIMAAGRSWAQDTSQWVTYAPVDPINQLACAWHAYPKGSSGVDATVPGFGIDNYTWAQAILDAGYPIIIGETGDHNVAGTVGAPFMANLLPWIDAHGVSVTGWTWNVWGNPDDVLIKDASGTPTDGYGVAYKNWTVNHK